MVRIIQGTIVDVGMGRIKSKEIPSIIESLERKEGGRTAPPQGLYLVSLLLRMTKVKWRTIIREYRANKGKKQEIKDKLKNNKNILDTNL